MEQETKDYGLQEAIEKQDYSLQEEEVYPEYHPRDAPNFAITADDLRGFTATSLRIVFSPEDEEKMKNMTKEEMVDYKSKLLHEGKYKRVPYD